MGKDGKVSTFRVCVDMLTLLFMVYLTYHGYQYVFEDVFVGLLSGRMEIKELPKEDRKEWDALVKTLRDYGVDATQKGIETVNMFMAPCYLLFKFAIFW